MKGLNKEQNVHLRISNTEKTKYQNAAAEVGLTVSGYLRYAAAKAARKIKAKTDEILKN